MKCPVCGENTITVDCHTEDQGEPPWTALITIVDSIERECDCQLSTEQEDKISDEVVCSEYEDWY